MFSKEIARRQRRHHLNCEQGPVRLLAAGKIGRLEPLMAIRLGWTARTKGLDQH